MMRNGNTPCTDVESELQFALEMDDEGIIGSQDYISQLPDGCLARIFKLLCSDDRKNVSLISKRMLKVEGQCHQRLTLDATQSDSLRSLFSRFDRVEVLVLRCDRPSAGVDVDEALIVTGKYCANSLKELGLIGVDASGIGLEYVATNCVKLERLALRCCETIRDGEIRCIASQFAALKELWIEECPVTDEGIKAFGWGYPNLVEIKVNKCKGVTSDHVVDWLGETRGSLLVNIDVLELDSSSDGDGDSGVGSQGGGGVDIPVLPVVSRRVSDGWPPIFRSRCGIFGGRGLARGA
ncbi:hypothetical protein Vadar_027741 [Vaccinium darrowii]|uniref:Uncharacterized protein n=1 Tax=Vaccinium darrowii TaxID=229202 RepID=A0ACB7XTR7_9ERIC|nr:hypothetical protein Vadar_027741 [Vaccinium darrowii]